MELSELTQESPGQTGMSCSPYPGRQAVSMLPPPLVTSHFLLGAKLNRSCTRHVAGAQAPERFLCNTVKIPAAASRCRGCSPISAAPEVRQRPARSCPQLFTPQHQGTSDQEPDSIGNWSSQEANRLIRCGKRQKPERSKTYPRSLSELVDQADPRALTSRPMAIPAPSHAQPWP